VFTVGSIFYVVLPLYEKALLEEQISEKELRLSALEKRLQDTYRRLRDYSVSQFVFSAGAECSGLLLEPPPEAIRDERKNNSFAERALSIDPVECLNGQFDRSRDLQELTEQDRKFLFSEMQRIARELSQVRDASKKRFDMAAATVASTPSLVDTHKSARPGGIVERLLGTMSEGGRERFAIFVAVDAEQAAAADVYSDSVRAKLSELRSVEWPSVGEDGP
jgi:hypothetical protein